MGSSCWTCIICRDGIAHYCHHLSRHLNGRRHKETVEHLDEPSSAPPVLPPQFTDQSDVEFTSEYAPDDVIDNISASPIDDNLTSEVSYGVYFCDRQLMASQYVGSGFFLLQDMGDVGSLNPADANDDDLENETETMW